MATKRFSELTPVSTIQNGDFFAIESAIGPYQKTTWSEIKAQLTLAGYANVNDSSLAFLATTFSVVGATAITLGTVPSSSGINIGSTGTYSGVINIGAIATAGRITIGNIGIVGLDLRATSITIQDSAGAGFSASGGGATMTAAAAGVASIVQNGKAGFEMTPASETNVGHADYVTKLKGSKVVNTDSTIDVLHKPTKQYQIDGDFNDMIGSSTSTGYTAAVMWKIIANTGSDTISPVTSPTLSKTNAMQLAVSAGQEIVVGEFLDGNPFEDKIMSVFVYAKHTGTAPTEFRIALVDDGATAATDTISLTDSYAWYRVDLDCASLSATNYSYMYFDVNNSGGGSASTVIVDKIRITETNGLASGIIPDWVKEDEDVLEMKDKVLRYYQKIKSTGTGDRFSVGYQNSATIFVCNVPLASAMNSNTGTVSISGLSVYGAAGTIAVSALSTNYDYTDGGNNTTGLTLELTTASTTANVFQQIRFTGSTSYIEIDKRY